MTMPDRFDRRLPELLERLGAPSVPDYFDDILTQTARTRQRPAWTSLERWIPLDLVARAPVGARRFPPMSILLVLLLMALVAAVALVGSSRLTRTLDPFGPAANGLLVYDRNGDLFTVDPATGTEVLLIGGDTNDFAAGWTRDGNGLMFLRGTEDATLVQMIAEADGSNVRPLAATPYQSSLDWSADGRRAVIAHQLDGRGVLSIVDRTTGATTLLDTGAIEPAYMAIWRGPAGEDILFVGSPDGTKTTQGIYLIDPDGTNLRTVQVHGPGAPGTPEAGSGTYGTIRVSESGRQLVYERWEPAAIPAPNTRGMNIHVLDLETGVDRRMMYAPDRESETSPALSPDDTTIAFESMERGSDNAVFMVAPLDGSGTARAVSEVYRWDDGERSVGFSPDGKQLLVTLPGRPPELIDLATGRSTGIVLPESAANSGWQRRLP